MTISANPLLLGQGLPPFDHIQIDQVESSIGQLLQELEVQLNQLEANIIPTWAGLVEPLTAIEEKFSWSWGIVGHLMGVKNSSQLRQAYENIQPEVIRFSSRIGQSKPIYEGFKAIRISNDWANLDPAQQRIIESTLKEAQLSGVGLEGENLERFNQNRLRLAELSTKFSNNVIDATKVFKLKLTEPEDITGLPESLLALSAQTARAEGEENATAELGPWLITLDFPSYGPFMKYSSNRILREKVYKALISKASFGQLDNNGIIEEILKIRREQSEILGFSSYAEVSLSRKMASDVEEVEQLLEDLRKVCYPAAIAELEELKIFAEQGELEHWDIAYWAERQREAKFAFNLEELRPYFPLPQVLDGLFGLAKRIFAVTIEAADGQAPLWHRDVRYFQVKDEAGEPIAYFYLDPYSRPAEKRGGAWMNDCIGRARLSNGQVRLPVAYLICNQTPPIEDQPSLMTFDEVNTLFHEFGHGLQHMLTLVDYPGAAGINNIEWDAVELPSQFMENWCYDRQTLFGMAKHYQTGEVLPEHYYDKLLAARNYMSATGMLRQLHFSLLDLELHHRYQSEGKETVQTVRERIAKSTMVLQPLEEDSFLCSFGHIFAGGYAAGYYSYKWAEVLSADAFAAFEEVGLENDTAIRSIGKRFRETVLSLGGSLPPMEVFKAFRGREPKTEPLLRHSGLLKN